MVVAHELRAYSDVIAAAVGVLRPHLLVTIVTPADLDAAVATFVPQLVLASCAPLALPAPVQAWIELYPGGSNHAVVHRGGDQTVIADIDFDTLMALIDTLTVEPAAPPPPVIAASPAA